MTISNFSFSANGQLHFGPGKFKQIPGLIKGVGKNILLMVGGEAFHKTDQFEWLVNSLFEEDLRVYHASVSEEPSPGLVDKVVDQHRDKKIDGVVGIGGGSVMDGAKAVSAMLTKQESVLAFLEGKGTQVHDGKKVPFIAVPTTAGTGSEATQNAVLSQTGAKGFKKSLRHKNFVPDLAVVDPELTLSCPREITAACGMDALTQLIESFVSPQASIMTDALAEGALGIMGDGVVTSALKDPADLGARTRIAYGAYISGLTLANAGLGVVHGFASVIGGYFPIPHGVVCGTLLGEVTRKNVGALVRQDPESRAFLKYARVGELLGQSPAKDPRENAENLCCLLEQWVKILKIPRLGSFGVTRKDIPKIVRATAQKNNPIQLSEEELKEILEARI